MKTYLINSIKQVSVNSQSWDIISTLKAQEWIVYNEDIAHVEKFLFIDDSRLLVSVNGKSSYSKWNYIKVNSSLIIDDEINKYLLKIVVCNKDIIVLNVDSTNDYSFLINSKSSILRNPTYADIQWYLIRYCGIDILNEQQRNQFVEEKKLESEKKKKEQKEKEREHQQLLKGCLSVTGIVFVLFAAIAAIKSYNDYKKYHPTIYITEERNKVAVDLGLSVKWASCNIGANSPEEYGNYYGWGDVTGQNVTKGTDYSYENDYQFPPRNVSEPLPSSITNSKFDMAKANWGGSWRLPTKEEAQELIDKCSISKADKYNGNYCFKITGPNGNYIYLPLSDLRFYDGDIISRGKRWALATVWTGDISFICRYSDEHERLAYALEISETDNSGAFTGKIRCELDHGTRWYGRPVRAVIDN